MEEHRNDWYAAAAIMVIVGAWQLADDGVFLGLMMLVAGVLCALAGVTGRDYMGKKPTEPSESGS